MSAELIKVDNLSLGFSKDNRQQPILRHISLSIKAGETIGIVGESGSGKSTLALALMGYLKSGLTRFEGEVYFAKQPLFSLKAKQLNRLRGGQIALIPQNAGQALTPTLTIGAQIGESLKLHTRLDRQQRYRKVIELLNLVRLPSAQTLLKRYPHQLSGGQQQRVAIAMALACGAKALLLDEPTTGLDVTTQAHILEFLRELAEQTQVAMVYVSHDLGVIARVCQRVVVMYAGEIVEQGDSKQLLSQPQHPYTQALLQAIPRMQSKRIPSALQGFPPLVGEVRSGCAFAPRCANATEVCRQTAPLLRQADPSQAEKSEVRCHFDIIAPRLPLAATAETTALMTDAETSLLTVSDLAISYQPRSWLDRLRQRSLLATVAGINFSLQPGKTLALVGESGSGKSTILRAIAGLQAPLQGSVQLGQTSLAATVKQRSLQQLQALQMIFQNADSALNPRHTIAEILSAPLKRYFQLSGTALQQRCEQLMEAVRLPKSYLPRFPAQLSGGEKQRIGIARAFAAEPQLILCDEVTSALDVSIQAAILTLLKQLQAEKNTAYILVSHDLAVVRAFADQIAVLYQGRICEIGSSEQIFSPPFHPYTEVLLGAILEPQPNNAPKLLRDDSIVEIPAPQGCPFQHRCPKKIIGICEIQSPPNRTFADGHQIFCHRSETELMIPIF
ncbi:ABC transporter ATP-binding protein [Pasteurellaceae bacterium USgator11]|nr:ABC transporter ATP-binding protein [Pasteurellaceae bacterium USgator41]TNG93111.1 ABC transporter ATP-binding protein [Pasteurellaceae bacterium UScroc12]TNG95885.1 ABC transporter ATP-binding protein [Pasteurellaceae bacterium UScroc31]TNG98871.1 ABC transporter ATP-binding protein [Pasteurellaceae bacterium USgator11]